MAHRKGRLIWLSATALLASAAWLFWLHPPSSSTEPVYAADALPVTDGTQPANAMSNMANQIDSPDTDYETPDDHDASLIAQSLADTQIDGKLKAGADGNLVLNQEVRDFFDYFLSAADEIGPAAAIAEIDRYIVTYLPPQAAQQAQALLNKYLQFKRFEIQQQAQPMGDADPLLVMRNVFEEQRQQQDLLFSAAEKEALFGLESAYQEYTLATLELFADENISDAQRDAQLQLLENALPADLRQSKVDSTEQRKQQRVIDEALSSNASDSELHQRLQEHGVSQQKADEILAYRQQQQHFDSRYQQYLQSKLQLNSADENYPMQLEALQRELFPLPEQQTLVRLRDLASQ